MQRVFGDRKAVCLTIKRVNCDKTKESSADILIPSSFSTRGMVGGVRPLLPEMLGQLTHPIKNGDFQSMFARSVSAVAPSEKSSIITNRKSITGFPVSLKRTAYVAFKPPKVPQKSKRKVFSMKVNFSGKKSAIKFLCVKTFSVKVVRHSLAYLSMHKWLVGDVPFYLKCWAKATHPPSKSATSNRYSLVATAL